ncbi:hypothetical protein GQ55_3G270400 [Panicum hallii var. hallii]|uniref:Uncharacterized protein n=1 Tax=Panicum hallii var. hallii TaxID=1504633 RepID=A0A2T7EDV7_9POAL|nr:hypothetical protein GQ55_3G270400 [Panicum hallii var. hallii]
MRLTPTCSRSTTSSSSIEWVGSQAIISRPSTDHHQICQRTISQLRELQRDYPFFSFTKDGRMIR